MKEKKKQKTPTITICIHTNRFPHHLSAAATSIPFILSLFGCIVVIVIQRAEIGLCYGHTQSVIWFSSTRSNLCMCLGVCVSVCFFLLYFIFCFLHINGNDADMQPICAFSFFDFSLLRSFQFCFCAFLFFINFYILLCYRFFLSFFFFSVPFQCRCHFAICK